jgi:hypothetical protein
LLARARRAAAQQVIDLAARIGKAWLATGAPPDERRG